MRIPRNDAAVNPSRLSHAAAPSPPVNRFSYFCGCPNQPDSLIWASNAVRRPRPVLQGAAAQAYGARDISERICRNEIGVASGYEVANHFRFTHHRRDLLYRKLLPRHSLSPFLGVEIAGFA